MEENIKQIRHWKMNLTISSGLSIDDKFSDFRCFNTINDEPVPVLFDTKLKTSIPTSTMGMDLTILSNSAVKSKLTNKTVKQTTNLCLYRKTLISI